MRNLVGLEMVCFCKSRHFTLEYVGGGYVDEQGQPAKGVMDMGCFSCSAAYYTLSGDYCPFCPNCGHIDRKRFNEKHELVDFLQGQDFSWLKRNGQKIAYVQTFDMDWQLRFTKDPNALAMAGQYRAVSTP
tara:strand:- start:134 stop:526 length:393 start_codon:yes stop_codon:yes gene_type:complete